jgi:hypothetical protein
VNHLLRTKNLFKSILPVLYYSTRKRIDILLDFVENKKVLDLGFVEHEVIVEQKKRLVASWAYYTKSCINFRR